ncbi:hypothetical protein EYF80_060884 [Liparis tanakae]|uniref:Uncharacterized protein n=1 Tax=Liparis tanakae TaxID=230148 RepID=A0A4Z2EJM2_9TELE|nr:hypothetical protein EYF80_060884 [Liparis tanakae]
MSSTSGAEEQRSSLIRARMSHAAAGCQTEAEAAASCSPKCPGNHFHVDEASWLSTARRHRLGTDSVKRGK